MDLDELAERLAGYYDDPNETETDFDNRVTALRAHLDSPWWVLQLSPEGEFWGFMSWLRTDELGAWMVSQWGFLNIVHLALPMAMSGPHCVMMYAAVDPDAPPGMATRLWVLMREANQDAETIQTFFRRPGQPFKWTVRHYPSTARANARASLH